MNRRTSCILCASLLVGLASTASARYRLLKPEDIDKSKPVELKLKFPEGRAYFVESVSDITQSIQMGNTPMKQFIQTTTCFREAVEKSNDEVATLDMQFDRMAMNMNMAPMGAMNYDSDAPGDGDAPMVRQIFEPMLHKPMKMDVTPAGDVKSFSGMDAIREEVAKGAGGNMMWAQMQAQFSDDVARQEYGEARFGFLPKKPVRIGDTWTTERTRNTPGLGSAITKTDYTLKDVKMQEIDGKQRRVAIIEFSSTTKPDAKAPKAAAGGMPTPEIESGSSTGTITFDFKRGLPVRAERESKLKLNVSGGPAGKMVIDVLSNETTIAMSSAKRESQRKANAPKSEPKVDDAKSDSESDEE